MVFRWNNFISRTVIKVNERFLTLFKKSIFIFIYLLKLFHRVMHTFPIGRKSTKNYKTDCWTKFLQLSSLHKDHNCIFQNVRFFSSIHDVTLASGVHILVQNKYIWPCTYFSWLLNHFYSVFNSCGKINNADPPLQHAYTGLKKSFENHIEIIYEKCDIR